MNHSLLSVLKFILAVLLLPIVWATSTGFHQYIVDIPGKNGDFFFWGMFGYLVSFLFFYQFWGVYELGQKITTGILQFMAPANNFMAKIVPFYLTVILMSMYLTTHFFQAVSYDHYFMFFSGFAFAMHLILTAQELQHLEHMIIKPTYLSAMMFAAILLIAVVVLLFDLVLGKFLFGSFIKTVAGETVSIYYSIGDIVTFK